MSSVLKTIEGNDLVFAVVHDRPRTSAVGFLPHTPPTLRCGKL